jgi:hypothetical protein
MMNTTNRDVELECRDFLNRFFDRYCDDTLRKRALKALRFVMSSDKQLLGKPAGWAAGIVYALCNRYRNACGVPDLLNKDLEEFFGVKMGTIRERAAKVNGLLDELQDI